jgi:hypothetical protein
MPATIAIVTLLIKQWLPVMRNVSKSDKVSANKSRDAHLTYWPSIISLFWQCYIKCCIFLKHPVWMCIIRLSEHKKHCSGCLVSHIELIYYYRFLLTRWIDCTFASGRHNQTSGESTVDFLAIVLRWSHGEHASGVTKWRHDVTFPLLK